MPKEYEEKSAVLLKHLQEQVHSLILLDLRIIII